MSEQIQDVLARMEEKFENKFQQQHVSNPQITLSVSKNPPENERQLPIQDNQTNNQLEDKIEQPIEYLTLQNDDEHHQNNLSNQKQQNEVFDNKKAQHMESQQNFPSETKQQTILNQQNQTKTEIISQSNQQHNKNESQLKQVGTSQVVLNSFKQSQAQQQQQSSKNNEIIEQPYEQQPHVIAQSSQSLNSNIIDQMHTKEMIEETINKEQNDDKIQTFLQKPSQVIKDQHENIKKQDSAGDGNLQELNGKINVSANSQLGSNQIQPQIQKSYSQLQRYAVQYNQQQCLKPTQQYIYEREEQISHQLSDNQMEESQNYEHLSQKLQTALQKIQTSLTSRNFDQTQNSQMFARFQFYEKKKQRALQQKRKEVEAKKLFGVSYKPEINKKSKNMMIEQHYEPIYSRYEQILTKKNKKIQEQHRKKKEKEEQQYQQFLKQFQTHNRVPDQVRSINDFYEEMVNWKKKKEKQAEDIAQRKKKQEIQSSTFKPIINKKSDKIASAKNRVPIQNRQIKLKNIKQQFTFTPKINKSRYGK